MLGNSRKYWAGEKKKHRQKAKLLCSPQNSLALPGAFLNFTDTYSSFSPSHGLYLEVAPSDAHGPEPLLALPTTTLDRTTEAQLVRHYTSPHPSPFLVFLQLKNPT